MSEAISEAISINEGAQPSRVVIAEAAAAALPRSFWPLWVLLTTAGYAAGMSLDDALYRLTGNALGGAAAGMGSVAIYGIVTLGLTGILQALLLRRRLERPYLWVLASMAGGAVGFILGTLASEAASSAIGLRLDVYTTGAIIQFLFGGFSGVAIGLSQWLFTHQRRAYTGAWVTANVVGLMIGFSIPVGIMQLFDLSFLGIWYGASGGLMLGLAEWFWMRRVAW